MSSRPYNTAMIASSRPVQNLLELLAQQQAPTGGWAALSSSSQAALEPTALACLALGREFPSFRDRAVQFLLRVQNPNGSWPVFQGDDKDGAWTTALALIALHDEVEAIVERLKGFAWLVDLAGLESNWL